jgi:hypothetical protein
MREDSSAWTGVIFRSAKDAQGAIDLAQRLQHESLPALDRHARDLEKATGIQAPKGFAGVEDVLALLKSVQAQAEQYTTEVFTEDLSALIAVLSKAKSSNMRALWLCWTDAGVKAARRRITELRKGSKIGFTQALRKITDMQELQRNWQSLAGGSSSPAIYKDLASAEKGFLSAKSETEDLQKTVGAQGWSKLSLGELREAIERYSGDQTTPYRMFSVSEIEAKLRDLGMQRLVDDLRQRKCQNNYWVANFDHCFLSSALDEMALESPAIRSFVGSTHGQYVEEFKQLDTDRLKLARDRVRRIHAEQTIAALNRTQIKRHS